MIRNVVTGRLREPVDPADLEVVDAALAGIRGLGLPGLLANDAGRDAGIRDGGWSYAIVNDWVDADAYRGYDADPEHRRHRAALVEVSEQIARVQLDLTDRAGARAAGPTGVDPFGS